MPIIYEDRSLIELRKLANDRNIKNVNSYTKKELIVKLRNGVEKKVKGEVRKSSKRLKKYESCVKKVKNTSKTDASKPYRVCNKAVYDL